MARPRTPTKILEMKGSFKTHPDRKREHEPVPNSAEIGSPPLYFSDAEVDIWHEIIKAVPAGVLGDCDRFIIEMASRLLGEYRTNPDMKVGKITQLLTALSRLGLTPADRSKVTAIPENKEASPWDKFGK